MASGWSRAFRRTSLSDGEEEDDSVTVTNSNRRNRGDGGLGSPRKPVTSVLRDRNAVNVSPNRSDVGRSLEILGDEMNGNERNVIGGNAIDKSRSIDNEGRAMNTLNASQVGKMTTTGTPPFSTPVKSRPNKPLLSAFRDVHDLTKLEYITMENVLECLRERYRCHQYYTYAGPVLLSLNSCLKLPRGSLIEDVTRMTWYFIDDAKKENENNACAGNKAPHVYDIGYQCLRNLVTVGSHQIILISGESGAGKTTATQQLIKYLTENNSRNFGANICSNLDKKIYFATIILESFGNAKTQANPNSSRFGRLVQLNYSKGSGQISGAEIQTYLLEKHRVAKYDSGSERNFHIFYYMLNGLRYGTITPPAGVDWTNTKGLFPQDLLDDALECDDEEVQRLINAVQAFNIKDFWELVGILLAMITLLKVKFVPDCDSSSEEEYYSSGLESPYKTEFTVSEKKCVRLAADLLGVNESELEDILIARKITAGSSHRHSIFRKPCESFKECEERLHAFMSFIYDRLFSFVLDHLNSSLKGNGLEELENCSTLSLLDLYGFENFRVNHLEQICINYANERLQSLNVAIIKSYYEQSIPPDEIMIPPTELLRIESELIQRIDELHTHVFSFLDEECLLKRSSEDKAILERMNLNLIGKKSKFITTGRLNEPDFKFIVNHYATKVEYQLSGLVQKNKDHIPPEFQDILRSSSNSFVNSLFKHDLIRSRNASGVTPRNVHTVSSNKNVRGKTILTRFKVSVEELMTKLKASENKDVHFVRCIRPNVDLLAGSFSTDVVEKQLHACGIADVVKIAGNGYPIRLHTTKFIAEFPKMLSCFCNGILDTGRIILIFCGSKNKSTLKFGKTMIFMSEKCWKKFKKLEHFLILHSTRVIQKAWKLHLEQKEIMKRKINEQAGPSCNSFAFNSFQLRQDDSLLQSFEDEHLIVTDDGNSCASEADVSQNVELVQAKRRTMTNDLQRPALYFGMGVASRTPVHTLPIKIYTKKTCIPMAEKPPRRLLANGIEDAFEDYGIVFFPS